MSTVVTDECPSCGAHLHRGEPVDPLLSALDMLVLRALEILGNRIIRYERSRFAEVDRLGIEAFEAHTVWQPPWKVVAKVLETAWVALPVALHQHGCCGLSPQQARQILDRYVSDLVDAQEAHDLDELRYRLSIYL